MKRPKRFSLPRTLTTLTDFTCVLNMSSTAALISGLVAFGSDVEHVLVALLADERALLGHDRREQHLHQALLMFG